VCLTYSLVQVVLRGEKVGKMKGTYSHKHSRNICVHPYIYIRHCHAHTMGACVRSFWSAPPYTFVLYKTVYTISYTSLTSTSSPPASTCARC
jgi:hypothetical protein